MVLPTDDLVTKASTTGIRLAQREDERHALHAEIALDADSASPYWSEFKKKYIDPTITADSTREQLYRDMMFPLPSNELVDDISDSVSSVHNAQDRLIKVELIDEKLQLDAERYLESIDVNGFVSRTLHNALMAQPNSVVAVDCPVEQVTDFPEPYLRLHSSKKIDRAMPLEGSNEAGLFKYVLLRLSDNKYAMFDDTHITVYRRGGQDAQNNTDSGWEIVNPPARHNLPITPCFKLWADTDARNLMASNTILRPSLALLDQYCVWHGAQQSNDLKAAFAILSSWEDAEQVCDYTVRSFQHGFVCSGGAIEVPVFDADGNYVNGVAPIVYKCPRCAARKAKNRLGPGSHLRLTVPLDKDAPDLRPGAVWVDAPILSLKYIAEKVVGLRATIRRTATGTEGGPQNKQALNEGQILSIIEAARQVGEYLAEYFSLTHKRILDCVLRMRYGDSYIGCTVNYGRRFAALSGDLLMKLQIDAKSIGADWLVEEIDNMIQDYYARGDASKGLRYRILNAIKFYKFMSAADMVAGQLNTLDRDGYLLSVGVPGYVERFEREMGLPIERFMPNTTFSNRVTIILTKIKEYVTEIPVIEPIDPSSTGRSGKKPSPATGAKRKRQPKSDPATV